ncbi:MAG: pitrilysin family protein [Pseudomonadota bacterium]|nr:pitrilysin family protein [Pseudomonadota bacterium]
MLRIDKLPNGLTVVTDTRSGTGSVALDIGLRAGPRFETPDIAGLSNLFGKMTTYGSNSRSRDQILQVIEGHGGSLNAVVESHGLHWIARILSRHLDESFAAIAEIMTDPKLDANDMESEKCNIAQQILNMEGVPRAKIGEKIRATAFTGQGMGNSLIGDATLLAGYTRKDLEAFRDSYLHASEMVVVAVGDVSHDRMMKLAAAGFGSMPNVAPRVFAPLIFTPGTYIEDDKDKQQINLRMAFKGPGREHPERFAATMFARIFGGDMVSPLFQEIRKKRSLAYGVRMLYNAFDGDGFYQFAAGIDRVKPGKSPPVAEAIPVFYRTLAEFLDGGMTQIQFTSAREKFHKELICNFHGTMASAGLYAGQILNEGRLISPDEFASCLGGLSMNHVYDVGLRMLADADKVAVAAIGPQDGMADTAGLASFAREAAIKAGAPGPVPGVRPKVPAKDTSSSADTPSEGMKTTVLSNGMKIVTYQIPGTGLVSSGFWVGAGSQDETAKENGAAHALEHMAFKGTPSWPSPGGIDRSVELDYAAYLNAYTSKDVTAYYNANVRPCDLPVLMKMFGEMTFKATVASEEFEGCDAQGKQVRKTAEKQVVVNEMNMYLDDASDQADNLMERTAYPRQPHGRPVIGTNKSLNPMTAAMLRGFRDRVYVPANTTLAVSGDITHDEVVAMAKKLFGHLPSGQVVHPKTPRFSPGMKTERRKRDLIELMIGFPRRGRTLKGLYRSTYAGDDPGAGSFFSSSGCATGQTPACCRCRSL